MIGQPPFLVLGSPGGPLAFPVQNGRPVLVSRTEFEACCCRPLPIICAGMPTGDCVFEITKAEYRAWASAGTWRLSYSVTGGESYNSGTDGDIFSSPPGAYGDLASVVGCAFSDTFSGLPVTTTYFGSFSGVYPGTSEVAVTINLGIVDGRYYAGVTLAIDAGGAVADSAPTPTPGKENNGTFPVTVGGHVIPMQPRWTLSYTESLGAENTIVWTVALVRI